ncbi:MAG: hypothetical protein KAI66_25940 [Lentisphaeria bacterium]|nr:hypothetical protein [Lentisphaeria bacterium]
MTPAPSITVDHRERAPELVQALRNTHGFSVEFAQLDSGDYEMPPDILVERKTTRDFCLSVIDGRLFQQAYRLVEGHYNSLIIIEGASFKTDVSIDMACVRGALVTLAQTFRLPTLRTRDQLDTAWTLARLHRQRQRIGMGRGTLKSSRSRTLARRKEALLRSFPGIGPKLAGALMRHFGSIEAVVRASEEELLAVSGMGEIKARSIRDVVAESAAVWPAERELPEPPPPDAEEKIHHEDTKGETRRAEC